uniref:Neurotransmitter-gated ion-channel ligand-binding domain-containing protein n=1 Tax=Strigamia maritima TaxID=126957 RepID=T1IS88_STRMM
MNLLKMSILKWFFVLINVKYYANSDENANHGWLEKLIPDDYKRWNLPIRNKNLSIIYLQITPNAITSISIQDMDFTIENNYLLYWFDLRLKPSDNSTVKKIIREGERFELPYELIELLWKPTLAFKNCKKCQRSIIPDEKTNKLYIYPYSHGAYIATNYRNTMNFVCPFNLKLYPFDIQECSIDVEMSKPLFSNYSLRLRNVHNEAEDGKIEIPPEYSLLSAKIVSCRKAVNNSLTKPTDAPIQRINHDCYKFVFRMRRNTNSFIILTFIPSGLIVIISCLSFWLDPEVAAPRVAIGLTSLLTLATQFNNVQKELPPVAYIKALDIWMFFCMFFVFATLIEFTTTDKKNQIQFMTNRKPSNSFSDCLSKIFHSRRSIDYIARILFPLTDENDNHGWLKKLIPDGYKRWNLPIRNKILNVIYLYITPSTITSISIQHMDFTVENNYFLYWFDPRLKPSDNSTKEKINKGTGRFELPHGLFELLWQPAVAFKNCKKCQRSLIPDKKTNELYIYPYSNGAYIATNYRNTMSFVCPFNLKLYPFDIQECSINIEMSKSLFSNHSLRLINDHNEAEDGKIEIPPEYSLLSAKVVSCRKAVNNSFTKPTDAPERRNHNDCYKFVFRMRRNTNSFIILTFIPSGLIVIISCLSFWLDPEVAAPRVAIGLTSLLTLATQFNNVQKELPPVAYIKALDIWMFFCMFFVFATLVEFTTVNFFKRKKKIQTNQIQPMVNQKPLNLLLIQESEDHLATPRVGDWVQRIQPDNPVIAIAPKIAIGLTCLLTLATYFLVQ